MAEGVDEKEQSKLLMEQGCDEVQRFLYSQALSAEEFASWLVRKDGDESDSCESVPRPAHRSVSTPKRSQ